MRSSRAEPAAATVLSLRLPLHLPAPHCPLSLCALLHPASPRCLTVPRRCSSFSALGSLRCATACDLCSWRLTVQGSHSVALDVRHALLLLLVAIIVAVAWLLSADWQVATAAAEEGRSNEANATHARTSKADATQRHLSRRFGGVATSRSASRCAFDSLCSLHQFAPRRLRSPRLLSRIRSVADRRSAPLLASLRCPHAIAQLCRRDALDGVPRAIFDRTNTLASRRILCTRRCADDRTVLRRWINGANAQRHYSVLQTPLPLHRDRRCCPSLQTACGEQ